MHVSRLALTDFRCYATVDLHLGPGVTGFVGPNGHGKTNLVEAVSYAATLASHRTATDTPLVRQGAERAIVRVQIETGPARTLVELEINPGRANRASINRSPQVRPREVIGALRTVLFAPEDLAMVKGDPGERRRFLDELLVARAPRFSMIRADYDRIVRQRTALLKSASMHGLARGARARGDGAAAGMLSTLDAWDEHLARTGGELLAGRLALLTDLRPLVGKAYAGFAGGSAEVGMRYRHSFGGTVEHDGDRHADRHRLAAALRDALSASRAAELDRGQCLTGPHRDELELSIGPLPARGYASHGESWSLALALRLASYDLLRADGAEPVLLLDDVFAELDPGRRDRLAQAVRTTEQALVTAAADADVPPGLADARFTVRDGSVVWAG